MVGNSLVVQWLGLPATTEGVMGSIPGQGTKISRAAGHSQKKKKKKKVNGIPTHSMRPEYCPDTKTKDITRKLQAIISFFLYFGCIGSQLWHAGSFVAAHRLLSSWGMQFFSSLVVAHELSSCGAQAYLPCSMWDLSSMTRDRTRVSCIARQILYHWTTREVLKPLSLMNVGVKINKINKPNPATYKKGLYTMAK